MADYDVIILGAGIAGMTSALTMIDEAKRQGRTPPKILMLEGDKTPGGRVKTMTLPGDIALDTGAHWFHGGENSSFYKWTAQRYGTPSDINMDKAEKFTMLSKDGISSQQDRQAIGAALETAYAAYKKDNPTAEPSLRDIFNVSAAKHAQNGYGDYIAQCWQGVTSPDQISAREFFEENGETTPGGIQLKNGIGSVMEKMARELRDNGVVIETEKIIKSVQQGADGVIMTDKDGHAYSAKKSIVTASIGVLQKKYITFDPPHAEDVENYINSVQPAKMTKIIIPVTKAFLEKNDIAENSRYGGYGGGEAFFCLARACGEPMITLFLGGDLAEKMEKQDAATVRNYAFKALDQIGELKGYREAINGEPVVTGWNTNPLYACAYSAMKPGHGDRRGPLMDGNLMFAGEAFAPSDAATMTGAWSSGKKAGMEVLLALGRDHDGRTPAPEPTASIAMAISSM